MTKEVISLEGATSYYTFNVEIANLVALVTLNWVTTGGFYKIFITIDNEEVVRGKGLHPDIDLFKSTELGIGKLYLQGDEPTLDNIGIDNRLVYESI